MNILLGFLLGFSVCSLLTHKMLEIKAKENKAPKINSDGEIYWEKIVLA